MSEKNIDLQEESIKEEIQRRKKIRSLAIKTFVNFLASEVIGFGLGVPLATILAIIYGNIADVFMEIYFMPIVIMTVLIVLFVAYPTNLYLTRHLIKTIFTPTIENAQKFLLTSGSVSLYASIHLLIRISIGGLIADVWGVLRQGEFSLGRFITLGISPIVGAFVASIVFYFVSQKIFSNFNIEIIKIAPSFMVKKEEVGKAKLLSSSKVFSGFISFMVLLVSIIISIGYLFNATFVGMLIIVGLGVFTISLLLYFYVSTISEIVKNLKEATKVIGKKGGKLVIPMLYDIDKTIFLLEEYLEKKENEYAKLLEKISKLGTVQKFYIFNSFLETKFKKLTNELRKTKIPENLGTELKKTLEFIGSNIRSTSNKLIELENNTTLVLQEFGKLEEEIEKLGELSNIRMMEVETYFYRAIETLGNTRKTVESIKESVFSVVPKVEEFEKIKNNMEVVFINFQLEMARIGYPLEFKVISDKLGKELERIENSSYEIKNQASEISKNSEVIVGDLREMAVLLEIAESMFEEIKKTLSTASKEELKESLGELRKKVEEISKAFKNIRGRLIEIHKIITGCIQTTNIYLQKTQEINTNISNIIKTISNSLEIFSDNLKDIQKLDEEIKILKKINEQK